MSDFKEWWKEILPLVQAAANGEVIQGRFNGAQTWVDSSFDWECFVASHEYRIKPRTIKIGDFDVPEPMRVEPDMFTMVYCVTTTMEKSVSAFPWTGSYGEVLMLKRGMVHADAESAKIHAGAIISLTAAE